jgi:2-oxo-3-hexenedioate decarboxylase
MDVKTLAKELDEALLQKREIAPLTKTHGDFTLGEAYRIQEEGLTYRLKRGERVAGYKMGLTSAAKREQMNLGQPIYGYLSDAMQVRGKLKVAEGVHPKIEPEIAFITNRELHGAITRAQAFEALESVFPALEVLDSRFIGFKYFSLPDVVADNCSSWRFILGTPQKPRDPGGLQMRMSIDGKIVQEASSDAISGNPLESLVQLAALLPRPLPRGSIVLAGAATAAAMLAPGMKIELSVDELGSMSVETE